MGESLAKRVRAPKGYEGCHKERGGGHKRGVYVKVLGIFIIF